MSRPKVERRKHLRVEEKIPLKIKDEGFDTISVTKNISCSGVFCQVDGYFPLLSKVKIVLLLPSDLKIPLKIKDEGFDTISVTKNISCSGVFCQVDGYFPLLSKVKIVLLLP